MNIVQRLLILSMLLFYCPSVAYAQNRISMGIIVEELDSEAQACGVTVPTLRAPATLVLRNNRVNILDGTSFSAYLYLRVGVIHQASMRSCIYNITVSVRDSITGSTIGNIRGKYSFHVVTHCDKGSFGVSPQQSASKSIVDSVEQYIKECLADLNY